MSVIPWLGSRRVAIVPVLDLQEDQEPPPDWEYQVRSRVFYDPSRGRAWIGRSNTIFRRSPTAGPSSRARSSRWCGPPTPR
jgi:hypothetical protein